MKRITSRQHALVALYRAVARGDDLTRLLLDGVHVVSDALDAGLTLEQAAIVDSASSDGEGRAVGARLSRLGVEVVQVSASVMDALSPVRSSSPIVALATRPTVDLHRIYASTTPLVIAAISVQDPGNLGAIVRVAEAGGASGVIAAGSSADPFGWKALRGAMGSALRLPVMIERSLDRLFAAAHEHHCRIVAAVPRGGRDPGDVPLHRPTLLLVGGEGQGLPAEALDHTDELVTIPMASPVESLNTATSAALLIYEARRQRLATPTYGLALPTRS